MGLSEASESEYIGKERRSSIRARSMLPCKIERVPKEQIMEVESQILDLAVLDAEHLGMSDSEWVDRADDLPREVRYILSEMRALRQQMTDIRRSMEQRDEPARWVVLNDRGLWLPTQEGDIIDLEEGDFVKVYLSIPSLSSPQILALGEIIRVRQHPTRGGFAVEFRSISDVHSKALFRYALRRERELARSRIFSELTDDD